MKNTFQISSTKPALIIFLLDQSGSMDDQFGNNSASTKAEVLADAINDIIMEVGERCLSNGEIRNRFELAVIGYGQDDNHAQSAWQGNLRGRWIVSISEVFENPLGVREEAPYWISPIANVGTPMANAFNNAFRLANDWINWGNHSECFPPIIINISDGAPTDAGSNNKNLLREIENINGLRTALGNPLVLNIHISDGKGDALLFPETINANGTTQYAKLLFNISSTLTSDMIESARLKGYNIDEGAKGYVYNGNAKQLYDFLSIGSNG